MTNPLWLRVFADVGSDRYLSHAELPSETAARARAVWELYDRLFGRFTGAGLDPLFHRLQHAVLTIAHPVFPRGVPLVIVGTGPSLEAGVEELRRVRARVVVATSPRGAIALQARGLHADLVLIEHQSVFDAQVSLEELRHTGLARLHPETLVLAEPATPPALLPPDVGRVRIAEKLPTWGLWPATLVALALEASLPAVGLLGIDLGGAGQLDPQHKPLASLLELLAYASGGTCRDIGLFGSHKPGWPRASLTAFAETATATHSTRGIEWRDERPANVLIDRARQDLRLIAPILPAARAALEMALQARAGNVPASERDLNAPVETMLAWGADPHLRWVLQRALGVTFLPRFWRTGVRMVTPTRLWRPLILALHELTLQSDRLARALADAEGRPESENAESYVAAITDPDAPAAAPDAAAPPSTSESSAASEGGPADPAAKHAASDPRDRGRGPGYPDGDPDSPPSSAASGGRQADPAAKYAAADPRDRERWPNDAAAGGSSSQFSAASGGGPADPAAKYAAPQGRGDGAAADGNPFYKTSAASEGARSHQASRHAASETPRPSRVSVLLPVKNGLPLLHDAIASLVAQTHPDVEILVIDDGSTDGGPQEVVAQALSHVRVIKSNGQGVAAALNAGLRAATGAFIARQDADDWSHPERLARQFEYLSQHADVDVLATCAEFVDREGRPVETSWTMGVRREQDTSQTSASLADLLPVRSALVHGSIMARRDVLREAGGYRPQAVYAEDYDLWLRLLPKARFAKLPTRLYTYRLHDVTVSQQYRDIQQRSTIRAKLEYLQRRYPNLPPNPRLLLAGEQRDLAAWREIASDLKFAIAATTLPAYPDSLASATLRAALDDADVVAIADLDALVDWIARMEEHAQQFVREGNFFIRLNT